MQKNSFLLERSNFSGVSLGAALSNWQRGEVLDSKHSALSCEDYNSECGLQASALASPSAPRNFPPGEEGVRD